MSVCFATNTQDGTHFCALERGHSGPHRDKNGEWPHDEPNPEAREPRVTDGGTDPFLDSTRGLAP